MQTRPRSLTPVPLPPTMRTTCTRQYASRREASMAASILTHYNSREARSHFADLMREVVRDGRPVVIAPRDETASVVVERELLLRLLDPYAPHVEIIPEDGTDGFTIWVEELRATARGASLAAAREAMARDAFSEVHHFLPPLAALQAYRPARRFPVCLPPRAGRNRRRNARSHLLPLRCPCDV